MQAELDVVGCLLGEVDTQPKNHRLPGDQKADTDAKGKAIEPRLAGVGSILLDLLLA